MLLTTQARIEEYNCATRLYSGNIEGAKLAAKRANIFQQTFLKVSTDFWEKLNNDNGK